MKLMIAPLPVRSHARPGPGARGFKFKLAREPEGATAGAQKPGASLSLAGATV